MSSSIPGAGRTGAGNGGGRLGRRGGGAQAPRPSSRMKSVRARQQKPALTRTPLGDARARSQNAANAPPRTRRYDDLDADDGDPKRKTRVIGSSSSSSSRSATVRSRSRSRRDLDGAVGGGVVGGNDLGGGTRGGRMRTVGGIGEATLASPSIGRPPPPPGDGSTGSYDGGAGVGGGAGGLSSFSPSSKSTTPLSRFVLSPRVIRSATGSIGSGPSRRVPVPVPSAVGRRARGPTTTPAKAGDGGGGASSSANENGPSNVGFSEVRPPRKRRGTDRDRPPSAPPVPSSTVANASASVGVAVKARYQSPTVSSRRSAVWSSPSPSIAAPGATTTATTPGRRTGPKGRGVGPPTVHSEDGVSVMESSPAGGAPASGKGTLPPYVRSDEVGGATVTTTDARTTATPGRRTGLKRRGVGPPTAHSEDYGVAVGESQADGPATKRTLPRSGRVVEVREASNPPDAEGEMLVRQLRQPRNIGPEKASPLPRVGAAVGGDDEGAAPAPTDVGTADRLGSCDVDGAGGDRESATLSSSPSSSSSPKVASKREVDEAASEARQAAEYRAGIQLRLAEQRIDALQKEMQETRLFYEVEQADGKGGGGEIGSGGREGEKEGSRSAATPVLNVDDLMAKVKVAKAENERLSNEKSALARQKSELLGEQSSLRATLEMYEMASSSQEEISDDRQVLQQTISILEAERDEVRSKLEQANALLLLNVPAEPIGDSEALIPAAGVGKEEEDGTSTGGGGTSQEADIVDLRASLGEAEADREQLGVTIQHLREELEEALASVREERDAASTLRDSLDEEGANIDDCRGALDRERDGRARDGEKFESEIESLREEVRSLVGVSGERAVLVEKNKELVGKLKDTEGRNTRLLDENRIIARDRSDLQGEISSLRATAEMRETAFSSQEQEWEHKLSVVLAERDDATEELNRMRKRAQPLEDRIRVLEAELYEAREELVRRDHKVETSAERIRLLETELDDVRVSTELSAAAMAKSVKDANVRVAVLEESCGASEREIASLRDELLEATNAVSSKSAVLEEIQASLKETESSRDATIQDLRGSLDDARAKLEEAASLEVESAALIDGLGQSLRDSNERVTKAESMAASSSSEIEALGARVRELKMSLEEAEANNDAELSEYNAKVSDLQTSTQREIGAIRSAHAKELGELKGAVTAREKAISRLEASLASANSLNKDLTCTIEKLRFNLEAATSSSSERGLRVDDLEHCLSELRATVGKLSREKKLAVDAQKELTVEKKSLEAELCSLEGKLSDLDRVRRELDEGNKRRATMDTTLTSYQSENVGLRERINEKSRRISGLETELSEVRRNFSKSLAHKDAQLELVEKELGNVKVRHDEIIARTHLEHEADMAGMEERQKSSSDRASALQETAVDLRRRLAEATSCMEEHKSQSSALKHVLEETKSSLASKVAQLKNDVSEKSSAVGSLEAERDSLRGDISSLQASMEMYEMSLRDIEEESDRRNGEAKACELEMQTRLERAESEKAELLAEFESLEVEYARLDKTVVRNKQMKGIRRKSGTGVISPSSKNDENRDRIEMEAITKYMMHREERMQAK